MNKIQDPPATPSAPSLMNVGAPSMPVGRWLSLNLSCDDARGRRRAPFSSPDPRPAADGEPGAGRSSRGRGGRESQEALVRACLEDDDEHAFGRLHERYRAAVYRVCLRVTGNAQDAEDAAQDTFLVVHQKLGTCRLRSRFSSWILRVAYNKGIEIRRSRRRTNPRRRGFDVNDSVDELEVVVDYRGRGIPEELCERESCERIAVAIVCEASRRAGDPGLTGPPRSTTSAPSSPTFASWRRSHDDCRRSGRSALRLGRLLATGPWSARTRPRAPVIRQRRRDRRPERVVR